MKLRILAIAFGIALFALTSSATEKKTVENDTIVKSLKILNVHDTTEAITLLA